MPEESHKRENFINNAIFRFAQDDDLLFSNSSPQRGGEFADGRRETSPDSEQIEYTVAKQHVRNSESVEQIQDRARVQVRGEVNSHTAEQHLQSDTNISCHTERKRKYPVTNSKELSCNKSNYIEINNQLDCFGSKEPHNDDTKSVILSECERSHNREDFTNNAILRGLNNYSPQKDGKNSCRLMRSEGATHVAHWQKSRKIAFTLAEVLITLGIIGVVAAITLPTLVANYQKKVLATRLKKEVNILANNFQLLFAKEGIDNLCNSDIAECPENHSGVYIWGDKYGRYFKLSEVPTNSLFYEVIDSGDSHVKAFNLADGSCVAIHGTYGGSWQANFGFIVDVNCDAKPNKWGRDRFIVGFDEKGKIFGDSSSWANGEDDMKLFIEMCENYDDNYSDENFFLGYCSYKIAQDGWEMKY